MSKNKTVDKVKSRDETIREARRVYREAIRTARETRDKVIAEAWAKFSEK